MELTLIIGQVKEAYEGDPWFGRNAIALLAEADETIAFDKINGQHSLADLLWHMVTWREFVISRLQASPELTLQYFEENNWRQLDDADKSLWKKGKDQLAKTQEKLMEILQQQDDAILAKTVPGRTYSFKKLLYGIVQHDIYHLGQIAYLTKALKEKK